jgi:hypothetical protein
MAPFISSGDIVYVRPVEPSALRTGDLLLYRKTGDRLLLHRLLRRYRSSHNGELWIITKGDAAPGLDPPVRVEHILGRVERIEKMRPWWGQTRLELRGFGWRIINYSLSLSGYFYGRLGRPLWRRMYRLCRQCAGGKKSR